MAPLTDYETVAKSQTAQVLGPTGHAGDVIERLIIIPETTAPGQVLLLDSDGVSPVSITIFLGSATYEASLRPIVVELGLRSVVGSWRITTGDNVHVLCGGRFT